MSRTLVQKRTVQRFIAGSSRAFRTIYEAYRDSVFTYALKFTKSVPDAEEVVQQSFIRLWEHRQHVDPCRPLDPYVYRIVRNCAFDYLKEVARTAQLKEEVRLVTLQTTYPEYVSPADYAKIAEAAIGTLPEKRQIIFRMSYAEGMTHEEIAHTLQLSVHTVKSQLVKATKTLRGLLLQRASLWWLLTLILSYIS